LWSIGRRQKTQKSVRAHEFAGNACPIGSKGGFARLYVRNRFG
jgi:hypothetical protein